MIVGIGVDLVAVPRFGVALERQPGFAERLFTAAELEAAAAVGEGRVRRLAATFAAKEAVAKALGAPPGLRWHDCEIVRQPSGQPRLEMRGTLAVAAEAAGVDAWQVSLSHDGDYALAYVIAEGR